MLNYWIVIYNNEEGKPQQSQRFPDSEGYEQVLKFLESVRSVDPNNGRIFSLSTEE